MRRDWRDEGIVTLTSSTDKNMKEYLSTKAPNAHGYKIVNIEWSDRVGQTKVTIEKDVNPPRFLSIRRSLASQLLGCNRRPHPRRNRNRSQCSRSQCSPLPRWLRTPMPIRSSPRRSPTRLTPPPRVRGVIQRNPVPTKGQPGKEHSMEPAAQAAVQDRNRNRSVAHKPRRC